MQGVHALLPSLACSILRSSGLRASWSLSRAQAAKTNSGCCSGSGGASRSFKLCRRPPLPESRRRSSLAGKLLLLLRGRPACPAAASSVAARAAVIASSAILWGRLSEIWAWQLSASRSSSCHLGQQGICQTATAAAAQGPCQAQGAGSRTHTGSSSCRRQLLGLISAEAPAGVQAEPAC